MEFCSLNENMSYFWVIYFSVGIVIILPQSSNQQYTMLSQTKAHGKLWLFVFTAEQNSYNREFAHNFISYQEIRFFFHCIMNFKFHGQCNFYENEKEFKGVSISYRILI